MSPPQLEAVTTNVYTTSKTQGIIALVVAGFTSLVAILILAGIMLGKGIRAWRNGGGILPQTHFAPYFASLLLANTLQAIGSILNLRWMKVRGTQYEPICVGQAVLKNIGDVGAAFWSLIIAFHVFDVLFLRRKQQRITLWATIIGIWAFILFIDMIGPVFVQKAEQGPFFGVAGYWCWITSNYPKSRIFLEYLFMFVSAFLCAVLHFIVFLRLRGNLSGDNLRSIRFRRIPRSERWALTLARDEVDGRLYKISAQLMWYPLIYTVVILPIAVARFVQFAWHDVPFGVTIFADFIFNLNGLLNVLLFGATYRRISVSYLPTLAAPRKSLFLTNYGITPFVLPPAEEPVPKMPPAAQVDLEKALPAKPEDNSYSENIRDSVVTVDSLVTSESTAPLTRGRREI